MRPRYKAAENEADVRHAPVAGVASMRPRHKAAENIERDVHDELRLQASMRPRHKAAENAGTAMPSGSIPGKLQ